MKYKKGLIFICLIICLFSIASVCASDVNETVEASDDQNRDLIEIDDKNANDFAVEEQEVYNIGATEENELSATPGTFTDLANDIANADGELNLTKNYVYNNESDLIYQNGIPINKKIIINGNCFSIDANSSVNAFLIYSNEVILKNISFINCMALNKGGALYWIGNAGKLLNCSFINCQVKTSISDNWCYGGAVYWEGDNGFLNDCKFDKCCIQYPSGRMGNGGAVYWKGYGGTLFNCNFNHCSFNSLDNDGEAGAICWEGSNGSLFNCSFENCNAGFEGGAIQWKGINGKIFNCIFDNCYSKKWYVGAVDWEGVNGSLFNCSFKNCHSARNGGAIYWSGKYGSLFNCSFENCYIGGNMYHGGAILWLADNGKLLDCFFKNCYGSSIYTSGGAVYWLGNNGDMINCSFENCCISFSSGFSYDNYGGGAICWYGNNGTLYDCRFIKCTVTNEPGGAIYWYGNNGTLFGCIFINCSVKFSHGDAIYWEGVNGSLFNSSFENCDSEYSDGYAVYWEGVNGSLFRCNFANCTGFAVNKFIPHLSVCFDKDDLDYGENIQFTSYIDDSDGELYIYMDNTFIRTVMSNEEVKLYNIDSGNHTIKIVYFGNNFYNSSELIKNLHINKLNITKPIIKILNKDEIYVDFIFNDLNDENIILKLQNNTYERKIINYTASFIFNNLIVSEYYNFTLSYLGDINHNSLNLDYLIKIPLKYSNFNISIDNIYLNDNVKINYEINKNATGTLGVYLNNSFIKTIAVGKDLILDNLKAGNYTVKVVYSGDDYYAGSECSTLLEVKKIEPFYFFNNDIAGKNVPFEFIIAGEDATGYINLKINEMYYSNYQVTNGKSTIIISDLKGGPNNYTLYYSGDEKYEAITDFADFYINYQDSPIIVDIPELNWGDLFIINPTLPKGATGSIEILIDNISLTNMSVGKTYRYNALNGGKHHLTVKYGGDDYFIENETTFEFNVKRFDSTLSVNDTIWANPSSTIVLQLNEEATGLIKLSVNNKQYSGEVINGTCKIIVNNLNSGSNNLIINYTGDSKYNPIYTVKELNVLLKDSKLNVNINNIISGNNLVIKPTVESGATGTYRIYVDNVLKTTINVGLSYTLSKPSIGKHEIKIVYSGDDYFKSENFTTSFRVFTVYPIVAKDMQIIYGRDNYFQAKFYDEYGNALANRYVQFNVNGTDYPVKTDDEGIATLNIKFDVGTYNVTSISILDEAKSNTLLVFHSVEAENMVIEYNSDYRFKATFLDETAKPLSKTGVIFILDGVTQPMVNTDVNGVAILDKALSLGTHTITSINTITNENMTNHVVVVSDINSIINVQEINDVDYGKNPVLTINIGSDYLNANIIVKITGDKGYSQEFSQKASTQIIKQLTGLNADKYTVDIKYQDNNNLLNLNLNKTFNVLKVNPTMDVNIKDTYSGGYATITVNVANSNGTVSLKVGSRTYNEKLTNGILVKTVTGLSVGDYDVEVLFEGDDNYNPLIKTGSFKMYYNLNFDVDFGSIILLEDKETYEEDDWGYTNYKINIYNLINDDNDVVNLFIDNIPIELVGEYLSGDAEGNEWWYCIEFSPAFLTEGNHTWEIKYSNIPNNILSTKTGSFTAINWKKYGGTNFELVTDKSITPINFTDIDWYVKNITTNDGEVKISTFAINKIQYYLINGLAYADAHSPIFTVFNPKEYVLYDGSYYKIENGKISDVIGIYDYEVLDGTYYRFIGRFSDYEKGYTVINGKCYMYDGFFHEAILGVDYKIVNGVYYTMNNVEIENINYPDWDIINGTRYYVESNYYAAVTPTTLGYDLVLINGDFYHVVLKDLDNKNDYYAIIDGKLYSVVNGSIGSQINVKQSISDNEITIPSLNSGSGTVKLPTGASGTITLDIAGKKYNFSIVNGVANVKLPDLTNGNYGYVITYSGDAKYASFTKTGSVTVNKQTTPSKPVTPTKPVAKTTITLKTVKVKKSAKKLVLQATLKQGKKALSGKKITFKFNGKKYTAKTNKKGIAKVTIKKNVLKKLKVGKKVKYQASYGKKAIAKKTAKVKK